MLYVIRLTTVMNALCTMTVSGNQKKAVDSRISASQVCINPFMTRYPFKGHMQTVQTQFRCCMLRHLIRFYTVCLQDFLGKYSKSENIHPKPLKLRLDSLILRKAKSTGQKRLTLLHSEWPNPIALRMAKPYCTQNGQTLLHSEWPNPIALRMAKPYCTQSGQTLWSLGLLSAIGLK